MATEAPPSYESVVSSIQAQLPANATAKHIFDAISKLPDYELNVIAAKAKELSPEEKKIFESRMTVELAKATDTMKSTATKVADSCSNIDDMFSKLAVTLTKIDNKKIPPPEGDFMPRLKTHQEMYRSLVHDSSKLAIRISNYGARFENYILPICQDEKLTSDQKVNKLDGFIKEAEVFKADSKAVADRFSKFKADFTAFIASFGNWAKDKLKQDKEKLKKLEDELKSMQKTLDNWQTALRYSIGAVFVGSLIMVLIGMLGPLGLPLLLIGLFGGVLAIGGLISSVVCTIGVIVQNIRVNNKKEEIQKLKDTISDIENAQQELSKAGDSALAMFNGNIDLLSSVWVNAQNHAVQIREALSNAKKDVNEVKALLSDMGSAAGIYKAMSIYLQQYADGIEKGIIPKGNPPPYKS